MEQTSSAVFNFLSMFIRDYRSDTSVVFLSLIEDDEDAEESGDDEEAEAATEEGRKQQEDEFTDGTREAEFCLESNLPADGEPENADTSREGGVFSQNPFTLKHVLSDVNGMMIMMVCSVFHTHRYVCEASGGGAE